MFIIYNNKYSKFIYFKNNIFINTKYKKQRIYGIKY